MNNFIVAVFDSAVELRYVYSSTAISRLDKEQMIKKYNNEYVHQNSATNYIKIKK